MIIKLVWTKLNYHHLQTRVISSNLFDLILCKFYWPVETLMRINMITLWFKKVASLQSYHSLQGLYSWGNFCWSFGVLIIKNKQQYEIPYKSQHILDFFLFLGYRQVAESIQLSRVEMYHKENKSIQKAYTEIFCNSLNNKGHYPSYHTICHGKSSQNIIFEINVCIIMKFNRISNYYGLGNNFITKRNSWINWTLL